MSLFKKGGQEVTGQDRTKVRCRQLEGAKATSVSSWVPGQLVQAMDRRIAEGEYRSRSDFVLAAVRHYEEHLGRKKG